ncbi:MAG: hypothetical protein H6647_11190 [Anaerolineales bacterium]|nr:hypothetical protein [Anaerolineales bacterium]
MPGPLRTLRDAELIAAISWLAAGTSELPLSAVLVWADPPVAYGLQIVDVDAAF